jgi:hypothetical protein
MATTQASPQILAVEWGKMDIATLGTGKDFKLYPGGGRAWDWGETGTKHQPGIQLADVEELVERGAAAIVLSRGMDLKLHVPDATVGFLEAKGLEVHVAETRKAVKIYNSLVASGTAVGGVFHSTC